MKITRVEAIPFAIPYAKPLRFASSGRGARRRARPGPGAHRRGRRRRGRGAAAPRSPTARPRPASSPSSTRSSPPQVVGLDLLEREAVHTRLSHAPSAIRRPKRPSTWHPGTRWGGDPPTASPASRRLTPTACGSRTCSGSRPDAMVAEAEQVRDTYGITTFKVKVGRRPGRSDAAVVRALREGLDRRWSCTSTPTAAGRPRSARRCGRWPTSTSRWPRSCAPPTTSRAPLAGPAARGTVVADESAADPGRRHPRSARRVGQHDEDKTARTGSTAWRRFHHLPRASASNRDGQPDPRPARHGLLPRVRRRIRLPPAAPASSRTIWT